MGRMIPRGHEVAGLGRRFLAYLIDVAPAAIVAGVLWMVLRFWSSPVVVLVGSIAAGVLVLVYGLFQWWAYATRGAGLGARATGLELVGLADGKPIGWWRVFLRFLVFIGLTITVVGGIAMVVFLIIHERRQGWHDMAVKSVLVQPKVVAEPKKSTSRVAKGTTTSTVGLPPHLADAFSPEAGYASSGAWAPQHEQPSYESQRSGYGEQQAFAPPPAQSNPMPQPHPGQQPFQQQPQPRQQPPQSFPQRPQQQPPPHQPAQSQPSAPPGSMPSPHLPPQSAPPQFPAPQPSGSGFEPSLPERSTPQRGWIPMPTPSSVLEPSQKSVRVRPRDFGDIEEDDGTTIASLPPSESGRRGDEGWYVRLDDGREVDLTVTVLLGRNPQRSEDDPEVHLVPASGDGRMISRTHVLIGTDPRGVYIVDRGSTNGTALVTDTGDLEPAPAGVQMRVRDGQQVSYGNRWFTVLRRPAQLG